MNQLEREILRVREEVADDEELARHLSSFYGNTTVTATDVAHREGETAVHYAFRVALLLQDDDAMRDRYREDYAKREDHMRA